jgi:hypothetical protein
MDGREFVYFFLFFLMQYSSCLYEINSNLAFAFLIFHSIVEVIANQNRKGLKSVKYGKHICYVTFTQIAVKNSR